jgi:shikimate kinase
MTGSLDNIVLIGFASTGKTAVGQLLAKALGFAFVDLDDRVEALHVCERGVKRRCRDIFSLFGRECFINYETQALDALIDTRRAVIAVGGGTPISEINRGRTKKLGCVVYLDASPAAIFERMKTKGFPKYLGDDPTLEDLAALVAERAPIYENTADIVINNTALSPEAAVSAVITAVISRGLLPENLFPPTKDIAS